MSAQAPPRGRPLLRGLAGVARLRPATKQAPGPPPQTPSINPARIALLRRQLLPLFSRLGASQHRMSLRQLERRLASWPEAMHALKSGVPTHAAEQHAQTPQTIRTKLKCTVNESSTAFILRADVPDLSQENVRVEVKDSHTLSITAHTSRLECDYVQVRDIRLPANVNLQEISAVLKDAVLTVRVSKQPSFNVVVEAPHIPTIQAIPEQVAASA